MVGFYQDTPETTQALENKDGEAFMEFVVGGAETMVDETEAGKQFISVETIGAERGYGPLIYLSLMELSRIEGLNGASPTAGTIKPKASAIWERFYKEQKLAKPLMKLDRETRLEYMNHSYINTHRVDLKSASKRHTSNMANDQYGEKLSMVEETIDAYINHRLQTGHLD